MVIGWENGGGGEQGSLPAACDLERGGARRRAKDPVPEWCVALPVEYKEQVHQEGKPSIWQPVGGKSISHCLCFQEGKNNRGKVLRGIFCFIANCV